MLKKLFLLLLVILLGACSNTPQVTPSNTPTDTVTPTPQLVTLDELATALLDLSNMPPGWVMTGSEITPSEATGTYNLMCAELPKRSIGKAEVEFEQSQLGPFLTETIVLYPPGKAEAAFADVFETAQSCSTFTTTSNDGTVNSYEVNLLSFPALGDESFAVRSSTTLSLLGLLETDVIYIRQRDVVLTILYISIGLDGIDTTVTEELTRLAYDKLQTVIAP